MRRETRQELLRHNFTPEEMAEKAQVVAQSYQRLAGAKEEKAAAASQYAERIKSEEALLGKTTREMSQGWETRPVDCKIAYNVPNTGIKTIYRGDTEEILKTESMSQDELQERLFEDPQLVLDPEKAIENNIRSFFGMSAKAPESTDPLEVQGWKQGEWIVCAASAEFAHLWMEEKGHAKDLELAKWEWCDPDTTIIKGLESFFGTDVIPLRRAIAHMAHEGIAFPMLLQIPADYLESLKGGKDPDAQEPQDEPKDVQTSKPTPETPAAPPAKPRKPRGPKKTDSKTDGPQAGEPEPEEPAQDAGDTADRVQGLIDLDTDADDDDDEPLEPDAE
jgi:hypothetical protein